MEHLFSSTGELWGTIIVIIAVVTIVLWIFLPWVVMRIEGKMGKAIQDLRDVRNTLKDILYELQTNKPTTCSMCGNVSDVELKKAQEWRANGFKFEGEK